MADVAGIAGDQLGNFVERVETLNEQIKLLNADKADVFVEAKAAGFDPKIMKIIIRRRAMTTIERDAEDSLVHAYERALEVWDATPLGCAAVKAGR